VPPQFEDFTANGREFFKKEFFAVPNVSMNRFRSRLFAVESSIRDGVQMKILLRPPGVSDYRFPIP